MKNLLLFFHWTWVEISQLAAVLAGAAALVGVAIYGLRRRG